jgi:NTE family protein
VSENTQTALVLQGGGAIGAYHLGVVKRLFEDPLFAVDVVSGVSIGAITAAVLAGPKSGDPVAQLSALWEDLTSSSLAPMMSALSNAGMYRPRMDYWNLANWTSLFSAEPLRDTLRRHVDFDALNDGPIAFCASAVNVETGALTYFTNRNTRIGAQHVMASCALPPAFPMAEVDGAHYWDGGLFDNMPLQPALDLLDPTPDVKKRVVVVSLFPRKGALPSNLSEVSERMIELQFASRVQADLERVLHLNDLAGLLAGADEGVRGRLMRMSPLFKAALQPIQIHDVLQISNEDPDVASGASDFSRAAIARRVQAGFADADRALAEHPRAA